MADWVEGGAADGAGAGDVEAVPDLDPAVVAGGGEAFAAGMHGDAPAGSGVSPLRLGQAAAGADVPDMQRAAAVDGGQRHAVGEVGEVGGAAGLAGEGRQACAGFGVPERHDLIAGARRQPVAVGVDANLPAAIARATTTSSLDTVLLDRFMMRTAPLV